MALHFPERPEVRLQRPPLVEVLCQVRYPPILRISKEEPIDFQERIRHRFPELEIEQPLKLNIPGLVGSGLVSAEAQPRLYRFKAPDDQTAAALAVDFYALSTNRYRHWKMFAEDLSLVHDAVMSVYRPAYGTRIGLRYVNRLDPTTTDLVSAEQIFDLVRPELTALLRGSAWSEPSDFLSQLVLSDKAAKLTLRTAYGQEEGQPFLLLDFDYFEEGRVELTDLIQRCTRYHDAIYRAFRWSFVDESLEVFGPTEQGEV